VTPAQREQVVRASKSLARRHQVLRQISAEIGPPDFRRGRPRSTHFAELSRAICYQQLAGAAARTIHGRFAALFEGPPTPETVLAMPVNRLRGAGLSGSKAASIKDLAQKVVDGEVQLARIGRLPDDEIVRELTLVRGIGRWTAEMFLIFQLGRLDVWPVDDLGVRKGYTILHRLREMPSTKDFEAMGDPFRPYRSIAAWYCWRATDTVLPDGK